MTNEAPFALYVRAINQVAFNVSDALGFSVEMSALAVSLFEEGPDTMQVQALYSTRKQAEQALLSLSLSSSTETMIEQLPDIDWVEKSQRGLPPVKAGRFWIYGSHDKELIPKNTKWPVEINAGLAFGTGHHGTTKGCLIEFDKFLKEGFFPNKVLDLGCGAGILAIAAAKALNLEIIATDIDSDAVEVTLFNARINNVSELIKCYKLNGVKNSVLQKNTFDLIFANILAGPLIKLSADIVDILCPNGKVILSGILDNQSDLVTRAFVNCGLEIEKKSSISGWTSITGRKVK
jgi:ribosomal protein L11 methyltransferase